MNDEALAGRFLRENSNPDRLIKNLDWVAVRASKRGNLPVVRLLLDLGWPHSRGDWDKRTILSHPLSAVISKSSGS